MAEIEDILEKEPEMVNADDIRKLIDFYAFKNFGLKGIFLFVFDSGTDKDKYYATLIAQHATLKHKLVLLRYIEEEIRGSLNNSSLISLETKQIFAEILEKTDEFNKRLGIKKTRTERKN